MPSARGEPTPLGPLPDGRQLTAPFTHIHIPDAYGASASQGGKLRPSVTVEPAHPFLYGDCLSFVYVHICLDLEFLGNPGIKGSGCKPGDLQDVIDKTVKAFEDGVQKLLSNIVCKCSTLGVHDTFGPGCRRRVRIVWHTDCKPKKGDGKTPGPTPMPLEIRCFRKKDAPFGLTTPDTKYEVMLGPLSLRKYMRMKSDTIYSVFRFQMLQRATGTRSVTIRVTRPVVGRSLS
jgi:hypothetical protein